MRFSGTRGALIAALALASALPAFSQTTSPPTLTPPGGTTALPLAPQTPMLSGGPGISDILSGTPSMPLSMKLGDLDGNWRRMTITGSLDLGTVTQVITSLLGSAGVGIYYTRGQSVTLGNTTYLVTYRTQPKVFDITSLIQMGQNAAATGKPPVAEKLTADTPLALTLLNLQSAGSLTDVRPFDLNTELTNSANAVKAFNDLVNSLGASSTPATATPHAAPPHRVYKPKPRKKYTAT